MFTKTFLFCGLLSACLYSFDLSRTVDRSALTVGDRVTLTLKATRAPNEKLLFPGPEQKFGDLELLDMRSREENKDGRTVEIREYLLTAFKLGAVKVPALAVVNAGDTADKKYTDSLELLVKPVPAADSADIVDIYGQESLGYGPLFYVIILLTLVLLTVLLFFLDRWLKKRKLKADTPPPPPPLPPDVLFEKELQTLLAEHLLEKGEVKNFHLRMSEILRRYIGSRFSFYALESTTGELLEALRRQTIEGEALRKMESFCDINDAVKFAKWIPDTALSDKLVLTAREFVQMTAPRPPMETPQTLR